jgi:branched-chain amino acid transport system ATP-binding protein
LVERTARSATTAGPILETRGLTRQFGGLVAIKDVSLALAPGTRHALIGPNGAGKTTLINLLTGVLRPTAGQILLDGTDITADPPHVRVKRGLARTFQINQLFGDLTPLETVAMAIAERQGRGAVFWRALSREMAVLDEAMGLLERFGLGDVQGRRVAELAYGRQRLLEVALALATRPRVLLLDEPAAGVPEDGRRSILDTVGATSADATVLLIEHDMDIVFAFADRITVLVAGGVVVEGTPAEVRADPQVRTAYLGTAADG